MAITIRQEKSNQGGAVATLAVTLTSTTLAGSVVAVAAGMDAAGTDITFTDDKSDSPTDSGSGLLTGGTGKSRMAAFLVTTTGAQVFTAHYTGSPGFTEVVAWEVTGLTSPLFDKHVNATGTSASASSGSTGTLSAAAEAGLSYIFCANLMLTGTEGAGWTEDEITAGNGSMIQHIVTAATTAITATGTENPSGTWDAWAVT